MKKTGKKIKKVKRIKFKRVFLAIIIIFAIFYLIKTYVKFPIRNIIIIDNVYLTDQEIIDMAGISNYPSIFKSSREIEKKLNKSQFINSSKVKKTIYSEIRITVDENRPLFYDSTKESTILKDGKETKEVSDVPILINYIPDKIYKKFIDSMIIVDHEILKKISEIKYDPNNVDEERFVFTMSDKNKVYITLNKWEKINNYNDIMKNVLTKYNDKKGILYLDEGEYFVVNK